MPAEPKIESRQRAFAVVSVDRKPGRQAFPPAAQGNRLALDGGAGHRARCAQGLREGVSGLESPAGTPKVCAENGESQDDLPRDPPVAPFRPEYLSPVAVARALPGGPDPDTVYRWIKSGLLWQGRRVRLAAVRIGGRWFVTREAVRVFLAAISGPKGSRADAPALDLPAPLSQRALKRRRERTYAYLRAVGIA